MTLAAALTGILVATLLAWLVRKLHIVELASGRSKLLLAGFAQLRSAQGDKARQALLIRVGSAAIAFGLLGLLAMAVLLVAVEATPTLLHWSFVPHGTYLASLSIVLLVQAMLGRPGRRG